MIRIRAMWDTSDSFSDLLEPLRLRSAYCSDWHLRRGWGVRGARERRALIHYMLAGDGVVRLDETSPQPLGTGDLALFPHGAAHLVAEHADAEAVDVATLLTRSPGTASRIDIGPGEHTGRMICAGLEYEHQTAPPLYRMLPEVLVVTASEIREEPVLAHALEGITAEIKTRGHYTNAVLLRGFELVYVLGLRTALRTTAPSTTVSRALAHPDIGRVLITMYKSYEQPWTLDKLAEVAGMSRTSFARTFRRLVGESPGRHLRSYRLAEARRLLASTNHSHDVIASQVGYETVVGLHQAFRAEYGRAPGSVRRRARATDAGATRH